MQLKKTSVKEETINTLYIMLYQLGMNIFIKKKMLSLVYDMCIRYD